MVDVIKRFPLLLVLILGFVFSMTSQATQLDTKHIKEESINESVAIWRFGLEEIENSVQDIYAQRFKKIIEKKTNGEVLVDIYPYGTLGESEDLAVLTALGTIQLAHASTGILGNRIPQMQVFTLPYLFSPDDNINKTVLSSNPVLYQILGNTLIDHNLRLLTLFLEGDMVWTTTKAIRHPKDFNNFKMRVMNSPLNKDLYRLYGADAIPIPYSEIYNALQLHLVDGQSNPVFSIEEMKFYEVTDYMIWAGQQKFTTSLIANQAWYLTLPINHKKALNDTIEELTNYIFERQQALNINQLAVIKKNKPSIIMITLTARQKTAFKLKSIPIREKYIEITGVQGKRLLEALEKALGTGK